MTSRYEILDIVYQDTDGVLYRAIDRNTGTEVALRRFFPYGTGGGGIDGDERVAYDIAVHRLARASHPALARVIDGGTDPVDGIPFLVTEWIEGITLAERLKDGPLRPLSTWALTDAALEASQVVSRLLDEESLWVDTRAEFVILSEDEGEYRATFSISPQRVLGHTADSRNLKPLLRMTEEAAGWRGRVLSGQAGNGLGAWVRSLRDHFESWSLGEARSALHDGAAAEPPDSPVSPTPTGGPAPDFSPRTAVAPPKATWWPWVVAGLMFLVAAGLMLWKGSGRDRAEETALAGSPDAAAKESTPAAAPTNSRSATLDEVSRRAQELAEQASRRVEFNPGQRLTLEGVVYSADESRSGVTRYIEFQSVDDGERRWAGFLAKDLPELDVTSINALVGKRARFRGIVRTESSPRKRFLWIKTPEDLIILGPDSGSGSEPQSQDD